MYIRVELPGESERILTLSVAGGSLCEWLQVVGWLRGASAVVAVVRGVSQSSLLLHRQRQFRAQLGTDLRVEDIRGKNLDLQAARRVINAASAVAPLDAVIVLIKVSICTRHCEKILSLSTETADGQFLHKA